jgi:hypothetical protein
MTKFVALSPGRQSLLCLSPVRFGSQFADFSVPAFWLYYCLLGSRQQLQEARKQEFKVIPLVTPNTRHAPGFVPHVSVFSSCPPAFWMVDDHICRGGHCILSKIAQPCSPERGHVPDEPEARLSVAGQSHQLECV